MKTMDILFTGNPKTDYLLVTAAWVFAWVNPQTIPVVLSSLASLLVIINQCRLLIKKNKNKNQN
jgi:hypothetical protein